MTLGDADFRKAVMKMIYRKLPKTASPSVTCHPSRVQFFRFRHSHLHDDEAKRQYSVKCQVGQVHSAKATVNARPLVP